MESQGSVNTIAASALILVGERVSAVVQTLGLQRVMRLNLPQLSTSIWDPVDFFVHKTFSVNENRYPMEHILKNSVVLKETMALQLPSQQGKVFAGEVFRAYVNILNNKLGEAVENVRLRVLMTTPLETKTLFQGEVLPYLEYQKSYDVVVHNPVDIPGAYVLECEINYELPLATNIKSKMLNDPQTMKRVYKFSVVEPFHLTYETTKLSSKKVALQCLCVNHTGSSIFLESISLKDVPSFYSVECEDPSQTPYIIMPYKLTTLRNNDVISFLCSLTINNDTQMIQTKSLGILEIHWQVPMGGERITRVPLELDTAISLEAFTETFRVVSCPQSVSVNMPFNVLMECVNNTPAQMSLVLNATSSSSDSIVCLGETQKKLPLLGPGERSTFQLSFVPLRCGIHPIKNVHVVDEFQQLTHWLQTPYVLVA